MNKEYYCNYIVMNGHLLTDTYKKIPLNSDKNVIHLLKSLVKKHKANLIKKEIDYLTCFKWNSSNFYCPLKIHKSKIIEEAVLNTNSNCIEVLKY